VALAVVVTAMVLSACASSFADGDDPNVGIGADTGSATVLRVTVEVAANGPLRTLDPFVVAITDPETDTTHVTYNSDALNRSALPEDAPRFFEAAVVGDEAYARNTPWPILDGGPDGILWGIWYRVDSFAFDDYQVDETDLDTWLGPFGQADASLPVSFTIPGDELARYHADGAPLAGLASLVLPLEPELGVRVTADGDEQDRISTLVIEPVELGVDDAVHRVEARFEHGAALADLGIGSAIDPPPPSLDG
jgi:hypothetical protein